MTTKISSKQDADQVVYLYKVAQDTGLWYIALAAPASLVGQFDPVFKQMIETVQFPK